MVFGHNRQAEPPSLQFLRLSLFLSLCTSVRAQLFLPGMFSMLVVPSLLEACLQTQRPFSKRLRQGLVSLLFLHFQVLCMDELSCEFSVKPRPPGISADFPGHGVLCLQEIGSSRASISLEILFFSEFLTQDLTHLRKKSLPKLKSVLRNSRV